MPELHGLLLARDLFLHFAEQLLDFRALWIEALKLEQYRPDAGPLLLIHHGLDASQYLGHMFALESLVDGLDVRGHVFGRLVSIDGVLGKRMVNEMVEGRRIPGEDGRQRVMRFADYPVQGIRIVAGKWQPPGKQQVENATRGPDIGPPVGGLAQKPFRRDVVEGADHHARLCVAGGFFQAGDAKIDNFDIAIRLNHDVCRLDVAVDNALLVCIAQTEAQLANDIQLLDKRKPMSGAEQILQ